ncbi:MAG: hypothetical protein HY812_05625 [Planctomycetes bacterium]|nr:hypothetical protein [Planctomycetota bacterium]
MIKKSFQHDPDAPARRASAALLLLLLLTPAALADVVRLKDGRTLRGETSKRDGLVIVATAFGKVEVRESDVLAIEEEVKEEDAAAAFAARFAALEKAPDAAALEELARWCAEHSLIKQRRQVIELLKQVDPDNQFANRALGLVQHGDRWVSREEGERLEQERIAEEMRAKGLVLHQGRWMSAEEKEALEKGLVRVGERWLTEDAARALQGWVMHEGKWQNPAEIEAEFQQASVAQAFGSAELVSGEHAFLVTDLPRAPAERLHAALEAAGARLAALFDNEPAIRRRTNLKPGQWNDCLAIVLSSRERHAAYAGALVERGLFGEPEAALARAGRYWNVFWPPLVYLYVSEMGEEHACACLADAHVILALESRNATRAPPWLNAGLSGALQLDVAGAIGSAPGGTPLALEDLTVANLKQEARLLREGVLPLNLARTLVKPASEFTVPDVAKSIVLVRVLLGEEEPCIGRLLAGLAAHGYDPAGFSKDSLDAHAAAFAEARRWTLDLLAERWLDTAAALPAHGILGSRRRRDPSRRPHARRQAAVH